MDNKRMLIVDGDATYAGVLTRTLRKKGFDVTSVRDAQAAMDVALSSNPAYVILEQQLHGNSGLGLIRPLRGINPATKILVLASHPSIKTAVDSIKLGAFNYLAKPAYLNQIIGAFGIAPIVSGETAGTPAKATTRHIPPTPLDDRGLAPLEWKQIVTTLRAHHGNVSAAARTLGMHRRTLQRKLEAHGTATGKDVLKEIREVTPIRRWYATRK